MLHLRLIWCHAAIWVQPIHESRAGIVQKLMSIEQMDATTSSSVQDRSKAVSRRPLVALSVAYVFIVDSRTSSFRLDYIVTP
jgi:hypothetical protein